ncbi:MAG: response regulator transcription factor [Kiritimatiellae bacterium]|nr:response regulator transcription factor [Kiritimatiellia bacterium]MBQ6329313.1 response regulator transcription factor [Kiritimatiellia bacterium]
MKKIKILIADDHAIMRMGLAAILNAKKDLEVIGEADSGEAAILQARDLDPDVIVMDILMPRKDGAEATIEILQENPGAKILILTSSVSADAVARALDAGASGALLKNVAYSDLVDAIRTIASGGRVVEPEILRMINESPPVERLSDRQLDILNSMVRGLTDADIAIELGLKPNGVRDAITQIYAKIGAANKAEAVAIALRKHLLKT